MIEFFSVGITLLFAFLIYMSYKLDKINDESGQQITFLKLIYEEMKKINQK